MGFLVDTGFVTEIGGGGSGGGLTSPVGVPDGGTGGTTAAAARTNLGVPALSHQHAGEDITSGTVAAARLGSGSPSSSNFLRGDGTFNQPTLGNLAAGTIPSSVPLRHSTSNTTGTSTSQPERFVSSSQLVDNVPSGWSHVNRIAGADYFTVSAAACFIGTAQSGTSNAIGFWRTAEGLRINSRAAMSIRAMNGEPTTIPTGGTWTTLGSVSGLSLGINYVFVVGHGIIRMMWDGTTLTKESGASTLVVAGTAGATEIAFRVNASNLQASNGTATARTGSLALQVGQ